MTCVSPTSPPLASRELDYARLLEPIADAVFLVQPDLRVGSAFSPVTARLLGRAPAGCPVEELLAPDDETLRGQIRQCLSDALAEDDPERCRLFLDLLPEHLVLGERCLRLEAARVDHTVVMVLRDVTDLDALQAYAQRQRQLAELVRSVLQDRWQFQAVLSDFRQFLAGGWEAGADYSALLRTLHTFKGGLAQLGFYELPAALHDMESVVARAMAERAPVASTAEQVLGGALAEALAHDLAALREMVGDEVLEPQQGVWLAPSTVEWLEQWAQRAIQSDMASAEVVQRLARLRERSLHEVLRSYDRVMQSMAGALGKAVLPLEIDGPDVWLRQDRYQPWFSCLSHVFCNAIDHGIESPAVRGAAGKPLAGRVSCRIVDEGACGWRLEIRDDGAGLDSEALQEQAIAAGWDPARSAVADWIFAEGVSSREEVTLHSGRGIGLAALRAAVLNLGGTVTLDSELGRGVCLSMALPWAHASIQQKE